MAVADQRRWDDYGLDRLQALQETPEEYLHNISPIGHWSFYGQLMESLGPISGRSVLDVGCGLGDFSIWMSRLGARVTGIDIGESLIVAAKETSRLNRTDCEFRVASAERLPFSDAAFDRVCGLGILHHLPLSDLDRAFRETHRVLKPGGVAVFVEPVENSRVFSFLQNIFPNGKSGTQHRPSILNRRAWREYVASQDDRDMTTKELRELGNGLFQEIRTYPFGFLSRAQSLVGAKCSRFLDSMDRWLFRLVPPLRRYCQMVLVEYRKTLV